MLIPIINPGLPHVADLCVQFTVLRGQLVARVVVMVTQDRIHGNSWEVCAEQAGDVAEDRENELLGGDALSRVGWVVSGNRRTFRGVLFNPNNRNQHYRN